MAIFKLSKDQGIPTNEASDRLAEDRIKRMATLKTSFTSISPRSMMGRK